MYDSENGQNCCGSAQGNHLRGCENFDFVAVLESAVESDESDEVPF